MGGDRLELLVIQPTSFCNLDCAYCYVPERRNTARMSLATLRRLCEALIASRLLDGQTGLEVLWHAGEPLAAGLPFYRDAGAILAETLGAGRTILQTFQTNATLITSAWCEFFKISGSNVGVSLDGPRDIHDGQRAHRQSTGSFDQVMRGVSLLHQHDIELNVLCVLTTANLADPDRLFDFFCANRVSNLGFNVEEIEGEHVTSSLTNRAHRRDITRLYSRFMKRFLELNQAAASPLCVREFRVQARHLWNRRHDRSYLPDPAEHHVGRIVTVSRQGDVFSWSPELASGLPGHSTRFSLGNIHDVGSMDDLLNGPRAQQIQGEILRGIERCRLTCRYFNVCGGGSPANKIYENGSFESTDTVKCRLQVQALTEVILEHSKMSAGARPIGEAANHANRPA